MGDDLSPFCSKKMQKEFSKEDLARNNGKNGAPGTFSSCGNI